MLALVTRTGSGSKIQQVFKTTLLASALYLALVPYGATDAFAQATTPYSFSIPPQPLAQALVRFSAVTGVDVAFDGALPSNIRSNTLQGTYSAASGLGQLLEGTNLTYRFSGASTALIINPAQTSGNRLGAVDEGTVLLDTITISGGTGISAADAPYQTPGSSAYISADEIEARRGTSPGDIFSGIPGVLNGESRNSGGVDVNIRGMQGQGRVPVIVDGASQEVSVYRGYNGAQSRSYIDPDFIGGMAIEKGPSNGADATGATGGVVRISTIKAEDILLPGETFGARLKGGFFSNSSGVPALGTPVGQGSNNDTGLDRPGAFVPTSGNGSVAIAKTSENFDIVAAYARRKTGNYHAGTDGYDADLSKFRPGEEVLNTSTDNTSWMLKGNFRWDDGHSLELGYTKYLSEYGEIMPTQLSLFGGVPYQGFLNKIDLDTYTGRYGWKPDDNDLFDVRLDTFLTKMDLRINSSLYSSGYPIGLVDYYTGQTRWGATLSNTSLFATSLGDFSLNYGTSFTRENVGLPSGYEFASAGTAGTTPAPRMGNREEWSGFATMDWQPLDWLTLSPSLRYSRFHSFDRAPKLSNTGDLIFGSPLESESSGWSPLGTIKIEPVDNLQLYAKAGSVLRSPSIFESLTSLSFTVQPDENPIRPERNRTVELGMNYMADDAFLAGDKLRLHAAYFDNHVKDYITRAEGTGGLRRINLDYADMRGFEVSGEYDTGQYFGGLAWNHYTHVMFCAPEGVMSARHSTCAPGGIYNSFAVQQVPPKDTVAIHLGGRFLDDKLTLGGRMTYVGKRMVKGLGDGTVDTGLTNIRPGSWNPYVLLDLYATYEPNENVHMRFSVDNVTDRYYMDALSASLMPAPGRTFRFDLTIKPSLEGAYSGDGSLFSGLTSTSETEAVTTDWTGFFVGANIGMDWSKLSGTTTALNGTSNALAANESAALDLSGASFGLQAGYNHQFSNGFVAGFEADISKPTFSGNQTTYSTESADYKDGTIQSVQDYQYDVAASAKAKFGYAFNRMFIYGTGGIALMNEVQTRDQYISTGATSSMLGGTGTKFNYSEQEEVTRLGFTLGAGMEYALSDKWSIKADYNYTRFSSKTFNFDGAASGVVAPYDERIRCGRVNRPAACPPGFNGFHNVSSSGAGAKIDGRKAENKLQNHSIKVGLNYRF
ncbi:TonB-dependent receptor [Pseudochrobactrum sp. Wa41.01b-1]|uniref:TonB-dependent receptor domain-containing protein n=1 Tax=Pseudochrobactrum sp. Wa41.01b-1 TaxID=2864102 RepID=UPI001C68E173|nr:TonB-dependent receptor [Pseudochrobactrum sp. Wa41.01b-1]QYM72445.1 TonB-dependent receptor [Pseudochrobactrum sp. Wa41.01b-1]